MDSVFAAQFSDMFKDFVYQQQKFQEDITDVLKNIKNYIEGLDNKTPDYNENDKQPPPGLGTPPPANYKPRKVVTKPTNVIITGISDKVLDQLNDDTDITQQYTKTENKKDSGLFGLIGSLFGGIVSGLASLATGAGAAASLGKIGKMMGKGSGLFKNLAPIASKILKPLKPVFRRLPLIGTVMSFYDAYKKFKKGDPASVLSGILNLGAGVAYAVPGMGTAIGIGVDILNWMLTSKLNELQTVGGEFANFGDMFSRLGEWIKDTPFVKWFRDLGAKGIDLISDFNGQTAYDFLSHVGLVKLGEFVRDLDKMIGAAFGLTDDTGNVSSLSGWMGNWIDNTFLTPITGFFTSIGEMFGDEFEKTYDDIKNKINKQFKWVREQVGLDINADIERGNLLETRNKMILYEKQRARLKKYGYTNEQLTELLKNAPTAEERNRVLKEEIDKAKGEIEKAKNPTMMEGSTGTPKNYTRDLHQGMLQELYGAPVGTTIGKDKYGNKVYHAPLNDFSISDGNLNAIVMGNKIQKFNKNDTIIGFKSGEALVEGIETLITVGKEQIQILQEHLKNAKQNIIAPSTSNTNNYSFNVDSGVDMFRKTVN